MLSLRSFLLLAFLAARTADAGCALTVPDSVVNYMHQDDLWAVRVRILREVTDIIEPPPTPAPTTAPTTAPTSRRIESVFVTLHPNGTVSNHTTYYYNPTVDPKPQVQQVQQQHNHYWTPTHKTTYYEGMVVKNFKGGVTGRVLIKTTSTCNDFNLRFEPKTVYLVFGRVSQESVRGFIGERAMLSALPEPYPTKLWSKLSKAERKSLATFEPEQCRQVDCANDYQPDKPKLCLDGVNWSGGYKCAFQTGKYSGACRLDRKTTNQCPACKSNSDCKYKKGLVCDTKENICIPKPKPVVCTKKACPQIKCQEGYQSFTPSKACCPMCRKIPCWDVLCGKPLPCDKGEEFFTPKGECCQKCRPKQ